MSRPRTSELDRSPLTEPGLHATLHFVRYFEQEPVDDPTFLALVCWNCDARKHHSEVARLEAADGYEALYRCENCGNVTQAWVKNG